MNVTTDWVAGLGTGLVLASGITLTSLHAGLVTGLTGVTALTYAAVDRSLEDHEDDEDDSDEVATDGGTVPDDTPQEAAPQKPTVLDVDVVGDRVLGSAERGDVSIVVEAPAGISAEELEQTLEGVPESIERTTERFADTTTMSANTTDTDGRSDTEDAADDGVGGGA